MTYIIFQKPEFILIVVYLVVIPRAYQYFRSMGDDGLTAVTKTALWPPLALLVAGVTALLRVKKSLSKFLRR